MSPDDSPQDNAQQEALKQAIQDYLDGIVAKMTPLKPYQYPGWLVSSMLGVGLILGFSLVQYPPLCRGTVAALKGDAALSAGQWRQAQAQFQAGLVEVPDSRALRLGLVKSLLLQSRTPSESGPGLSDPTLNQDLQRTRTALSLLKATPLRPWDLNDINPLLSESDRRQLRWAWPWDGWQEVLETEKRRQQKDLQQEAR